MGWLAKPEEGMLRCWRGGGHPEGEGEGEEDAAPRQLPGSSSCNAPRAKHVLSVRSVKSRRV